jgi:galactokinase
MLSVIVLLFPSVLLTLAHSYGARLTGGGWGGSCFALTDDSFTQDSAALVCTAYYDRFKSRCKFYNVSAAQGAFIHNE